jgi:hypothetical protein
MLKGGWHERVSWKVTETRFSEPGHLHGTLVCPTNPGLSLLAMACIFGPTACQYVLGRNMHSSFMRGRVIEMFRMVCTPGM